MIILTAEGITATRCDGCSKHERSTNEFSPFLISWPVGFHPITKEPVLRFIYEKQNPHTPITLHACPECGRRIRKALKSGRLKQLPEGPLRKVLLQTVENPENKFSAFQIHYLKESRLANA